MEQERSRPAWQLPPGVSRGTWDYVQTESIATQYDTFHAGHPLLEIDKGLVLQVAESLEQQLGMVGDGLVGLDLGCGTGRVMVPLSQRGWRVLGVDLSSAMLQEVRGKSLREGGHFGGVRGNLAQLSFLQTGVIDLAYCLYSSYGMVQGRVHRVAMLREVCRSMRGGGRLVLHVHNRGIWWRDPGGVRRCLGDRMRSWRDKRWEYGDRVYAYRGLPSMYLHIFSERGLRRELVEGGFEVERWIRLNRTSSGELTSGGWFPHLRAGGFIAVAKKGSK